MSIGHTQQVDVAAGTGFDVLVGLSAASRGDREVPADLAEALAGVGDTEGETWLNLLGVPLDDGAPYTAERLREALATIDGVELRRHLLGRFAWSWCTLAGIEDIESAAAGDRQAARRLLEHPRYYAGHAAASLTTLLPLDGEETRRRLLRAVDAADPLVGSNAAAELASAATVATSALDDAPPLTAIERITSGYRYVPEVEADRVVLVPHLEHALPLVLAQHRAARLIAYIAERDRGAEGSLVTLGRALSDPKRVEILALVGRGVGRSGDLVKETGLTRSTVHHHLAQLRAAGLVALEGNAHAYTYVPRRDAPAGIAELIATVVGPEEQ